MRVIDIMEMVGWDPNVVHATLHSGAFNHMKGKQRGAQVRLPTACTAFHRYQLDWRPDSITIGVDGKVHMRVANDKPGDIAAWPFTRPYDLILNLAMGGDWGGKRGIDDAALPQRMTVDIRALLETGPLGPHRPPLDRDRHHHRAVGRVVRDGHAVAPGPHAPPRQPRVVIGQDARAVSVMRRVSPGFSVTRWNAAGRMGDWSDYGMSTMAARSGRFAPATPDPRSPRSQLACAAAA